MRKEDLDAYAAEMAKRRADWMPGPWDGEPDRVEWRDERTGYPCLLRRSPGSGAWCGYVGLPPGHPAYGRGYDDVDADVHGGLTYAEACADTICHTPEPGEPDERWWLGFDCCHAFDDAPLHHHRRLLEAMPEHMRMRADSGLYGTYKDLDYARAETFSLAAQLKAMEP